MVFGCYGVVFGDWLHVVRRIVGDSCACNMGFDGWLTGGMEVVDTDGYRQLAGLLVHSPHSHK